MISIQICKCWLRLTEIKCLRLASFRPPKRFAKSMKIFPAMWNFDKAALYPSYFFCCNYWPFTSTLRWIYSIWLVSTYLVGLVIDLILVMLSQKCIKNIAWREGLHHTENWPFAKGSQPLKRSNFRGALAAAAVWTVKLKMRIFWSFKLKFPGHFELLVSCKALIPEGLRRPWVIQNCLDRVCSMKQR